MVKADVVFTERLVTPEDLLEPIHGNKTRESMSTARLSMGGVLSRRTRGSRPFKAEEHMTNS